MERGIEASVALMYATVAQKKTLKRFRVKFFVLVRTKIWVTFAAKDSFFFEVIRASVCKRFGERPFRTGAGNLFMRYTAVEKASNQ